MHKTHIISIAAIFALSAGAPLQAEENTTFQSLDADANGYISPEEAASNNDLSASWNDLDADKNNLLDMSEFSAFEVSSTGMDEGGSPAATPDQ